MENAPSWLKVTTAVILAGVAIYGAVRPAPVPQQATPQARDITYVLCEEINELKALARELVSLSPPDPDTSNTERRRYLELTYNRTRSRDCDKLINP